MDRLRDRGPAPPRGIRDGSSRRRVSGGVWAIVLGAAIMIAAVLQRPRYRSTRRIRHSDAGPGGGEDGFLEPRFRPTNEAFVDPTSRRLMRVYVDPRTGERATGRRLTAPAAGRPADPQWAPGQLPIALWTSLTRMGRYAARAGRSDAFPHAAIRGAQG